MDDTWGNAWSTAGSSNDTEIKNSILGGSKWNSFQRDEDKDTVDVGISSWATGADLDWRGTHTNLWNAESSTLDVWESGVPRQGVDAEHDESDTFTNDEDIEDSKDLQPRPILPTPPQSPLPPQSPPLAIIQSAEDTPPSSPSSARRVSSSPDIFGTFESAEAVDVRLHGTSWATTLMEVSGEVTDEPWGGAWNNKREADSDGRNSTTVKDEWELAQEAKQRQERKVPPQVLASLVEQWTEYAKDFPSGSQAEDPGTQSWRKGLDNVEGLTDLVESLIPATSFPPPQFSKSAVSRALKESLRLTRSFGLTQSSPMAHLYASKGSTDWERSVKAQSSAATDQWGWDLKHEPEENLDSIDLVKEKKGGGLLSFWGKKSSPTVDSNMSNKQKSPSTAVKPTSPTTSAQPSIDVALNSSPSVAAPSSAPTTPTPAPPTPAVEPSITDGTATPPSVVSRFFNRFSRKPSPSPTPSEKDNISLTLSEDDLSALSNMVPSTLRASQASRSGKSSHNADDSIGSLDTMLASNKSPSSWSFGKLPPPINSPPGPSRITRPASIKSTASESSFEARMAEAQLLDILENVGGFGPSAGYAPVSFDLIDSPEEPNPSPSILRQPALPSLPPVSSPPSLSQLSSRRSQILADPKPIMSSTLPAPLPPPMGPPKTEARFSEILAPSTPPPLSPLRKTFNTKRYDDPLPPTPKREVDELTEFFMASPPSVSQPSLGASSSSPNVGLLSTSQSIDTAFSDFGDFISPTLQTPSPPKVPHKPSRVANHQGSMDLVQKAASTTGPWPAPPPPLPQLLAPPPGGGMLTTQRKQQDLLNDDSPSKPSPSSGILAPSALPQPLFAGPPSRPPSASIPVLAPAPSSALTPRFAAPQDSKAPTKSGLSAQDLSFFEGL